MWIGTIENAFVCAHEWELPIYESFKNIQRSFSSSLGGFYNRTLVEHKEKGSQNKI